jgi:hypothetical protein
MQVLVVLFGSLLVYRGLGALGVSVFDMWLQSARFALATMFVFTAIAHFAPMKRELIAMVPPRLRCNSCCRRSADAYRHFIIVYMVV